MKTTDTFGTLLKDEELENITGGEYYTLGSSYDSKDVQYIFNVGDIVEVASGWGFGTVRCRIVERRIGEREEPTGDLRFWGKKYYFEEYKVEPLESHWYFYREWVSRSLIQK